jgi:hypothetical protein
MRELELELVRVETELRWTRRVCTVLAIMVGGNTAAHVAELFPM